MLHLHSLSEREALNEGERGWSGGQRSLLSGQQRKIESSNKAITTGWMWTLWWKKNYNDDSHYARVHFDGNNAHNVALCSFTAWMAKHLMENNGNWSSKWNGNYDPLPGLETAWSSCGSWWRCFLTLIKHSSRKPVAGLCFRPGMYQAPCNIRLNSA